MVSLSLKSVITKLKPVGLLMILMTISFSVLSLSSVRAQSALEKPCAQFPDAEVCAQQAADPAGSKVTSTITNIVSFIVYLTGAVSLLMVVIGGFKYVTSQGDANQTKSAKDTILWALIGLFISINAMFVVRYIISRL